MSRIEQLIEELSPDRVQWKELGEVCEFIKGKFLLKGDKGLGNIPIILYGELYTQYGNYIKEIVSYTSEDKVKKSPIVEFGSLLLPISSTTKEAQIGKVSAFLMNENAFLGSDALMLKHNQNPGYLVHLLNSAWFEKLKMKCVFGTTINHLHPNKLSKISIPILPLPIQQEIVRILDSFTELDAELQAELEARKKQYEYYREQLLNFEGKEVEWKTLGGAGGIAEIGTGSRNTVDAIENGKYPFYVRSANILLIDHYEFDEEAILTSGDGVGVGKILHYVNGKYSLHQRAYRFRMKHHDISTKYVFYYMKNTFEKFILGSAVNSSVTSVRRPMLEKYKIPIPPLPEQERIVSILDKFEALVNDELPAEIAARRKQYEYYREKLLTFEPLVS